MERKLMRRVGSVLVTMLALFAFASWGAERLPAVDWEAAERVQRGVRMVKFSIDEPYLVKAYAMRIDLKTPGLRFTGTRRDKDWGKPMPDYTNGIIRTRRVPTADFMLAERASGRDMIVAFNSCGWSPWCSPWNHRYGNPSGLCVTEGTLVAYASKKYKNDLFVAWKDGTCEIRNGIPEERYGEAQIAHCGFDIILTNGVECTSYRHDGKGLHPRTVYGLSRDGRWFFVLAVDGRQPGWSLGASYADLVNMMLACGATEALNMDGGGSTTMLYWDGEKPVMVNRHDAERKVRRSNGASMGIYIAE